jgi:hypothetical protein
MTMTPIMRSNNDYGDKPGHSRKFPNSDLSNNLATSSFGLAHFAVTSLQYNFSEMLD